MPNYEPVDIIDNLRIRAAALGNRRIAMIIVAQFAAVMNATISECKRNALQSLLS